MSTRIFLDCGNTSVKWARSDTREALSIDMPVATIADTRVATIVPPAAEVYVCAVHAQRLLEIEAQLPAHTMQVLGRDIAVPDCGQYHTCGIDRVAAGVAAMQQAGCLHENIVVIDAGTMLTVTAWRYDELFPFSCACAGGLIAPSPQACLNGMHASAPALPAFEFNYASAVQNVPSALAHDTKEQMQAAIAIGWQASAQAMIEAVCRESSSTQVYVSGGNACMLPDFPAIKNATYARSLSIVGLAHIVGSRASVL